MPNIQNYYNRFDSKKNYEALLFRDGKSAQGSEHNEMQSMMHERIAGIADALFKDGDIIRDAQIVVDETTGEVRANAGIIYLAGAVRNVAAKTFTISKEGSVAIGVRLIERIVSELEDPALYNPAVGTKTHGMSGAWRLQVTPEWGFDTDGATGDFYVVYLIDEGILRHKEAPPNLDSFNQSIAKYDRDSTGGGSYIVAGYVVRAAESGEDAQKYTVSEGRAHVYGHGVSLATSRRLAYEAEPDLRRISTEIHVATGEANQRIDVAHSPINSITDLRVTLQKTVSVVHGAYSGAADTLPDTAVVSIVECKQGDTVYSVNDDYKKTGDNVDWSPMGAEPAPGSTYDCTFTYMAAVLPEMQDFDGFSIAGAVANSSIIIDYNQALPRLDRLCLTQDSTFIWRKGVASAVNPKLPDTPEDMLPLATIRQTWREEVEVINDGLRVMSFATLEAMNERIDFVMKEVARNRLESSITAREAGARVGIFVDALLDDNQRDQGIEQTAAIVNGTLTLPISAHVYGLAAPFNAPVTLPYTSNIILAQTLRTGSMKVNPYMAFDVIPAVVTITPAIDRWTERQTIWASSVTRQFASTTNSFVETVSSQTTEIEYLRQISVNFRITGFGAGEILESVIFDGLTVPFSPASITADDNGVANGSFVIPAKVSAGAKTVTFTGTATTGTAVFVGQGNLNVTTMRQVRAIQTWIDPLAQTFVLEANTQICGIDLWFTDKADNAAVRVQIREVQTGMPTRTVLEEAIINVNDIDVMGNHTRILFPSPVHLLGGTEYAIVILCNDATTALAIAEMGKFDRTAQQHVGSQPYTVGVLLSSSNNSAWDIHQKEDLTFRLLEANFINVQETVSMGAVEVTDATDLIILALDETPTADTQVEYELTLPDSTVLHVAQGQPLRLATPVTGAVNVCANLCGTQKAAPLLWPGAQVLAGKVSLTGDYYTRSIPALGAIKATLIYNAFVPSGASVTPEIQLDSGEWLTMMAGDTVIQGDGVVEYSFSHTLSGVALIKIRLTLTGTPVARPWVSNVSCTAVK